MYIKKFKWKKKHEYTSVPSKTKTSETKRKWQFPYTLCNAIENLPFRVALSNVGAKINRRPLRLSIFALLPARGAGSRTCTG